MEHESIDHVTSGGIVLPKEHVEKEQGGVQIATVLDVGKYAFDDQPGVEVKTGDQVVTARYPGSALDLDPEWNDQKASQYRVILDTEVRCLVSENGADIA